MKKLPKVVEQRFNKKFVNQSCSKSDEDNMFAGGSVTEIKQFFVSELATLKQQILDEVIDIEQTQWGYAKHQIKADIDVFRAAQRTKLEAIFSSPELQERTE